MKRVPVIAVTAAAACLVPLAAAGSAATATVVADHAVTATYHGTHGAAARLAHAASVAGLRAVRGKLTGRQLIRVSRFRSPAVARRVPALRLDPASTMRVRRIGDGPAVTVEHAFNGLSQQDVQNFFGPLAPITPPDQGLCVGRDATLPGDPRAVFEPINLAVRETSPDGALLRPDVDGRVFYQDPTAGADVRCVYDPATQSFYFTEIGFPVATGPAPDDNNTTADVVVINSRGVAAYQFDTSLGGPSGGDCFGDQPKVGFDNNALVISTDEFCDPQEDDFQGAIVLAISKPELVAEDATVSDTVLGPVSQAGIPVTGLDPAIGTGSGTDYLVDSVPLLADGSADPLGTTLGLWTLRNTESVTTGHGSPVLTSTILPSEPYAFPVDATSTGDGSTFAHGPFTITSETALAADDSRISGPVNVTREPDGSIRLWAALDAAVIPAGDSTARDGAAWFEIDPGRQRLVNQGYVSVPGAYLLYPAIEAADNGPAAMVFTITSAAINPSAAFTTLGSGTVTTVAAGAGPHESFSDAPPFGEARWGDYSFAVPDPDGSGIWMATEYIPPPAFQAVDDNWGTFVFEVGGH